jgi:hypothetical protein
MLDKENKERRKKMINTVIDQLKDSADDENALLVLIRTEGGTYSGVSGSFTELSMAIIQSMKESGEFAAVILGSAQYYMKEIAQTLKDVPEDDEEEIGSVIPALNRQVFA